MPRGTGPITSAPRRRSDGRTHGPTWGRRTPSDRLAEFRASVAAAVRGGMSVNDAAVRFRRTPNRVRAICREEGLRFGAGGKCGASAAFKRARREIAAVAARFTRAQLAARFGVTEDHVAIACAEFGTTSKPVEKRLRVSSLECRRRLRPNARAILAEITHRRNNAIATLLLTTDLKMEEIATRCFTSRQRVHQVWRGLCESTRHR